MRAIADTSREAYRRALASGRVSLGQKEVLRGFEPDPDRDYTRAELGEIVGRRSGPICARVNELVQRGYLVQLPRRPCRVTGELAHPVRLAPIQRTLELFAA